MALAADATVEVGADLAAESKKSRYPVYHDTLDEIAGIIHTKDLLFAVRQRPGALVKEGNNMFSGILSAGPLADTAAPGTNGLGQILGSRLEMSNVDIAGEFSDLITTQRGFQASARIITTTDEMLQEVVNLKRS